MDIQLKKYVTQTFNLHGLNIKSNAMKFLLESCSSEDKAESKERVTQLVDVIIQNIDKSLLKGNFIDQVSIEKCLNDLKSHNEIDSIENEVIKVIDAFHCPHYQYDMMKKVFVANPSQDKSLHANAKAKADLFRHRYMTVLQRLQRHNFFSPPVLPNQKLTSTFNDITPLNSLLGNPGKKWVLGTISQITEGKFYLEDLNANVQVDFKNAGPNFGIVTENTIILANGQLENGVFMADEVMLPLVETREDTLKFISSTVASDMFGERPNEKLAEKLVKYDQEHQDNTMLVLSDVWLDSPLVMERLGVLFQMIQEYPPFAFIFMGNFTQTPLIGGTQQKLKTYFDQLANLIVKYPLILKSHFIFIPGPTDPTGSLLNILPKFGIPDVFTKGFKSKIPNCTFTTNPCRIRYCQHEIVVFRDDIVNRMRRLMIKETSEEDITQHVLQTMCTNSHLCPLPFESRPIYWNYDNSLSLYPLPHTLILGDKTSDFVHTVHNVKCFNPSSFPKDFTFSIYQPGNDHQVDFYKAYVDKSDIKYTDEPKVDTTTTSDEAQQQNGDDSFEDIEVSQKPGGDMDQEEENENQEEENEENEEEMDEDETQKDSNSHPLEEEATGEEEDDTKMED